MDFNRDMMLQKRTLLHLFLDFNICSIPDIIDAPKYSTIALFFGSKTIKNSIYF